MAYVDERESLIRDDLKKMEERLNNKIDILELKLTLRFGVMLAVGMTILFVLLKLTS